jgi:hypothetical protein
MSAQTAEQTVVNTEGDVSQFPSQLASREEPVAIQDYDFPVVKP